MSSLLNSTKSNTIETAKELNTENLKIYYFLYFLGLIIMISAYIGPILYYKIVKKKNFLPQNRIGIKHAI
jgi:uncharacterized Tic20 family protein